MALKNQGLYEIIKLPLTNCMIPQTLNTSPHNDSLGPQNLQAILVVYLSELRIPKLLRYRPLAVSWCQKMVTHMIITLSMAVVI